MNIVFLQGGLGNQMFQYALYLAQKHNNIPANCDIGKVLRDNPHNGYELNRIFGINLPHSPRRLFILKYLSSFTRHKRRTLLAILNLFKYNFVVDTMPSVYMPNLMQNNGKINFLDGYWQSERYFVNIKSEIYKAFHFNEDLLSTASKRLKMEIMSCHSVSIHVRRGDYVLDKNIDLYGGICTIKYYQAAIDLLMGKYDALTFYVFSDDIEWVRENLHIPNSVFVNCNKSSDSWQDMFLMSCCKHNIVANSSFSWWGAWLNGNQDKVVVSPPRFMNLDRPSDVIPDAWIRINSI